MKKTKKYLVTISAIVRVPADLKIGIVTTRQLIRANESGIREGIEAQFDDDAVIHGDMRVNVVKVVQ